MDGGAAAEVGGASGSGAGGGRDGAIGLGGGFDGAGGAMTMERSVHAFAMFGLVRFLLVPGSYLPRAF